MKRHFSINKLADGRWAVENVERIDLTEDDIKAIYSRYADLAPNSYEPFEGR